MEEQNNESRGDMVIYQAPDGSVELDVRLEKESIWLNLNQLAKLFDRDKSVISRHLRNVFQEGELERETTVAKNATVQMEGDRKVTRQVDYYNLDAIISVGYRVNSKRGTQFRIWATQVLRDHVLKGYTVNQSRLQDLNQAVRLVTKTATRRNLSGDEAKALLRLVGDYGRALELLDKYDREQVEMPETTRETVHMITHEEALRIVGRLRQNLEESDVFGVEKDRGLESALGAVMQSAGGKNVYPSLEEKAAHMLYFLVKNHAFVDGNKRIAAALFLWFLERNNVLVNAAGQRLVSENELVAMTLMIAESRPEEKDVLIRIVIQLICEETPS